MIEVVLAFVLTSPVERPVIVAPLRVAAGIVGARPVCGVVRRVAKIRPVRRVLKNRCPVRRAVRFVGGR